MDRRLLVPATLAASLFLSLAVPAFAEDDPQAFAEQVYETGWEAIAVDEKVRREWLSPSFAKIVSRHEKLKEDDRIGYDPLTDGTEADLDTLDVTVAEDGDKAVTVEIQVDVDGEARSVTLVLNRTPKGLKLDDIQLPDGTSVRADMDKAVKHAADAGGKADGAGKAKKKQKPEKKS